MALATGDFATLNRLLAQVLDLPAPERQTWLAQLDPQFDHLQPTLRQLIARADAEHTDDFLATLPKLDRDVDHSDGEHTSGDSVGPYRLLRLLGRGGMGAVWLAERVDEAPARHIALKLPLLAGQAHLRDRLLRERDLLAVLEHPGIARLYDAGVDASGQSWLALEYIDGQPIDVYCRNGALDVPSRVRVFLQVARAVAYAHTRLVLHRDLKPTNILVSADGEPHLLDFGVAKLLEDGGTRDTALTQIGGRALTPDYASPEQILGKTLTVASDVYSLGVVLYELLAGRRPYKLQRASRAALEDAIVAADPAPPSVGVTDSAVRRQLAGDLDTIVLKALKKAPVDRYATVDALIGDLDRMLTGRPVLARPDSAWYRARKFVGRNALAVGAAGVVTLALAVGAGVALWQAGVARAEAKRAQEINRFVLSLFDSASPYSGARSDLRAVDLLKQARGRIDAELAGRPDLQVELLATVGKSLYSLAAHDDAQATFQRALDLAATQPGPPSTVAAEAALVLSDLLVIRGDYATAERLMDQWDARLRAQGPSLQLAHLLQGRALLLENTVRASQAVPVAQQALATVRAVPGLAKLEVAPYIDSLARAQYQADQNAAALVTAEEARDVFEQAGGEAHVGAIRSRALIARILRDLGRLDEAAAALSREMPRLGNAFGEQSQEYAVNAAELAQVQNLRGDLASATQLIQAALRAARVFGTSSRSMYLWERLAAELALQQRDLQAARDALQRAHAFATQWPGDNTVLVVEMLAWQRDVLAGRAAPMPASLQPVRDDAEKKSEDGKPAFFPSLRAGVMCTLGHKALADGQPRQALDAFNAAAPSFDKLTRRPQHFVVPWCLNGKAHALMTTGAFDDADAALEQAMQRYRSKAIAASPLRAETLTERAQLNLRRGRIEAALTDAREADAYWQSYRPQSRYAGDAAILLGRALMAHGDAKAGQREQRRGEAIRVANRTALAERPRDGAR